MSDVIEAPAVSVRKELELVKKRLADAELLYTALQRLNQDLIEKHNKLVNDTQRIVTLLSQGNSTQVDALKELYGRMECVEHKIREAGL